MTPRFFAIAAALTAILAPQTANALSCLRPNLVRTFHQANEADERYAVLSGIFVFDEALNPTFESLNPEPFPATFIGQTLTMQGFSVDKVELDVTILPNCLSVWCGNMPANTPVLAFVEITDQGYEIEVGPCPQYVFHQPEPSDLERMAACIRGEDCVEGQP